MRRIINDFFLRIAETGRTKTLSELSVKWTELFLAFDLLAEQRYVTGPRSSTPKENYVTGSGLCETVQWKTGIRHLSMKILGEKDLVDSPS